jgi:hypothetical protein
VRALEAPSVLRMARRDAGGRACGAACVCGTEARAQRAARRVSGAPGATAGVRQQPQ